MSENLDSPAPNPGEGNRIHDLKKAWDMAYAEKPHTEDAMALRDIGERARSVLGDFNAERQQIGRGFSGKRVQVETYEEIDKQKNHIIALEEAERRSKHLADKAADKAARNHDSASS